MSAITRLDKLVEHVGKSGPKASGLIVRFWEKIKRGRSVNDCWAWIGGTHEYGYGVITVRLEGKKPQRLLAHRVSYMIHLGELPTEILVCHQCDNPPCCNPRHFFLGTHGDNSRDSASKGRMSIPRPWAAKLDELKVQSIRVKAENGASFCQLGREYKVSDETIRAVVHRRTWMHV